MSFIKEFKSIKDKVSVALYTSLMSYIEVKELDDKDVIVIDNFKSRYFFLCLVLYDELHKYANLYMDKASKTYLELNLNDVKIYADIIKDLMPDLDLVDFRLKTGYSLEEIHYAGVLDFKIVKGELKATVGTNNFKKRPGGDEIVYTNISKTTMNVINRALINVDINTKVSSNIILKDLMTNVVKTSPNGTHVKFTHSGIEFTKTARDNAYTLLMYLIVNGYGILGFDHKPFTVNELISLIVNDVFSGEKSIKTTMLVCHHNNILLQDSGESNQDSQVSYMVKKEIYRINRVLSAIFYAERTLKVQ